MTDSVTIFPDIDGIATTVPTLPEFLDLQGKQTEFEEPELGVDLLDEVFNEQVRNSPGNSEEKPENFGQSGWRVTPIKTVIDLKTGKALMFDRGTTEIFREPSTTENDPDTSTFAITDVNQEITTWYDNPYLLKLEPDPDKIPENILDSTTDPENLSLNPKSISELPEIPEIPPQTPGVVSVNALGPTFITTTLPNPGFAFTDVPEPIPIPLTESPGIQIVRPFPDTFPGNSVLSGNPFQTSFGEFIKPFEDPSKRVGKKLGEIPTYGNHNNIDDNNHNHQMETNRNGNGKKNKHHHKNKSKKEKEDDYGSENIDKDNDSSTKNPGLESERNQGGNQISENSISTEQTNNPVTVTTTTHKMVQKMPMANPVQTTTTTTTSTTAARKRPSSTTMRSKKKNRTKRPKGSRRRKNKNRKHKPRFKPEVELDAELVPKDQLEEPEVKDIVEEPDVSVEEFPVEPSPKVKELVPVNGVTRIPVTVLLNPNSFEEVITPRPKVKSPRGPKLAFTSTTSTTTSGLPNTLEPEMTTTTETDDFVDPSVQTLATLVYATEQIGDIGDSTEATSTVTDNVNDIDDTTTFFVDNPDITTTPVQDSWTWREVDPNLLVHTDDLRDPIMIDVKEPTTFSWDQFNHIKGSYIQVKPLRWKCFISICF